MTTAHGAEPARTAVALCVDRRVLKGLHVTLSSALRRLAEDTTLVIHLIHEGLLDEDMERLERTLRMSSRRYQLFPHPIDTGQWRRMESLAGQGWMAYGRLVAAEIIPEDRLVYLDADLIIGADVHELYTTDLGEHAIGAVSWFPQSLSQDRAFLASLGLPPTEAYFNSGVLLIDAARWRAEGLTEELMAFGREYGKLLPTADQTILNHRFVGDFLQLPRRFNTPVSPKRTALDECQRANRVVHLVSRPKPWDPLGALHGQSKLYRDEVRHTAIAETWDRHEWSPALVRRCLRMSRNYARCLMARAADGLRR